MFLQAVVLAEKVAAEALVVPAAAAVMVAQVEVVGPGASVLTVPMRSLQAVQGSPVAKVEPVAPVVMAVSVAPVEPVE